MLRRKTKQNAQQASTGATGAGQGAASADQGAFDVVQNSQQADARAVDAGHNSQQGNQGVSNADWSRLGEDHKASSHSAPLTAVSNTADFLNKFTTSPSAKPIHIPISQSEGVEYPRLLIDKKAILNNVGVVCGLCAQKRLRVIGVTKGVCGNPDIARIMVEGGVDALADSRIDNLERVAQATPNIEHWLIRPPMPSQVDRVVRVADVSFNSEEPTLFALNAACENAGIEQHGVVLLLDLGDRRDGFIDAKELKAASELVKALPHLRLAGVACNLTCLSFVKASTEKLNELVAIAKKVRRRGSRKYPFIVSGGNSATLRLMREGGVPDDITDLRLGESLLIGRERDTYKYLPGVNPDSFVMEAEVIEVKKKNSMPDGEIGKDSFGHTPKFKDRGEQVRVILALGNQDCAPGVMTPLDPALHITGQSCDHLVCVSKEEDAYKVGDIVRLRCGYHAILRAMNSAYIAKEFV